MSTGIRNHVSIHDEQGCRYPFLQNSGQTYHDGNSDGIGESVVAWCFCLQQILGCESVLSITHLQQYRCWQLILHLLSPLACFYTPTSFWSSIFIIPFLCAIISDDSNDSVDTCRHKIRMLFQPTYARFPL